MQAANPTLGDLERVLGALHNQALDLAEAVGTRTDLPPEVQEAIDDVVVSLSRAYEIVQDTDNLVDEADDFP